MFLWSGVVWLDAVLRICVSFCALWRGLVCSVSWGVRVSGGGEDLRKGGRGGLWSLFSASRPLPPSCPTSGEERMKSQSDFPSLRGLAHTLRFVMASIPLPGGLRDSNSALCVYAPWSLPGGRVAGGQPWGCHRSRLASRGLGAPSLHPATFSELCPDLCWAGWPRWPQGLSSGGHSLAGEADQPSEHKGGPLCCPIPALEREHLNRDRRTGMSARGPCSGALLGGPCSGDPLSFICSFICAETAAALITAVSL